MNIGKLPEGWRVLWFEDDLTSILYTDEVVKAIQDAGLSWYEQLEWAGANARDSANWTTVVQKEEVDFWRDSVGLDEYIREIVRDELRKDMLQKNEEEFKKEMDLSRFYWEHDCVANDRVVSVSNMYSQCPDCGLSRQMI